MCEPTVWEMTLSSRRWRSARLLPTQLPGPTVIQVLDSGESWNRITGLATINATGESVTVAVRRLVALSYASANIEFIPTLRKGTSLEMGPTSKKYLKKGRMR